MRNIMIAHINHNNDLLVIASKSFFHNYTFRNYEVIDVCLNGTTNFYHHDETIDIKIDPMIYDNLLATLNMKNSEIFGNRYNC